MIMEKKTVVVTGAAGGMGRAVCEMLRKQGFSEVILEEDLWYGLLIETLHKVLDHRETYIEAMNRSTQMNAIPAIMDLVTTYSESSSQQKQ